MQLTAYEALWFLPFVLPLCLYVCFTDMAQMRITNQAVVVLALVFLLLGPFVLGLPEFGTRLIQLVVVLLLGLLFNASGAVGAGDAKFAAAAAPFIAPGDFRLLLAILAANILAAFATHRIAKYSALRRLSPGWQSWDMGWKFPMGLSLGGTLAIYLGLGLVYGA
jgi:prepilin peptidase CpaA